MADAYEEKPEEMDLDTFATPTGVPQTHGYHGKRIFLRECYPAYYTNILEQVKDTPYMTVTGTPGIGKSMFYLYFFQRYRQENKDKQVVTVAFTPERKVQNCRVWNSLNDIYDRGFPLYQDHDKNVPSGFQCLHLYDGPPDSQPQLPDIPGEYGDFAMIAFSSPNAGWERHVSKISMHMTVYMPNWTNVELNMANTALELGLSEEKMAKRVALFGGTARYVLTKHDHIAETGRQELEAALSTINSIHDVKACFEKRLDLSRVVHRLLRYFVNEDDWTEADLKPASKVVAAMIHKELVESSQLLMNGRIS